MCDPISLIGIGLSVAGSFGSAYMQSAVAKQQAVIEQRQLATDIENEKIKAMQETNNRLEQFRKDEASNRAALSALGVENFSYQQGMAPYNKRVVARDVKGIEFNMGQEVGRKKYEIAVAGWKSKATSRSAWIDAIGTSAGKIGGSLSEGRSVVGNQTYKPVNG